VLKRAARGLVPDSILARSKQPYRAPDALSFVTPEVPEWVAEELSPDRLRAVGLFDPVGVKKLFDKCRRQKDAEALSNADNMALVGVLSTQVLHRRFVVERPHADEAVLKTREVR
jgi:asparagine synthase (glutamine-hydrolysing)